MLNNDQIKLVHVAIKAAGIDDARYRLLLAQYTQANGARVRSSTQMNNRQVDDLLAICESLGWQHPDKTYCYYREKVRRDHPGSHDSPSFAARAAAEHLSADLGWGEQGLKQMISRMTRGRTDSLSSMTHREMYNLIEAAKAMLSRIDKKTYRTLADVTAAHTVNHTITEETLVKEDAHGQIEVPI